MRDAPVALVGCVGMLTLGGCVKSRGARANAPAAVRIGHTETGLASWYGVPYHGRRTASGEVYDMEKLTAAHKKLPFETWVEVTNLRNGKQVEVRITDRGPFVRGRILDLSRGAAREVDMLGPGVDRVRLKVITPRVSAGGAFAVQAGSFTDRSRAVELLRRLARTDGRVVEAENGAWRVLIGRSQPRAGAEALALELRRLGQQAVVVPANP